jgi:predicted secreted protein
MNKRLILFSSLYSVFTIVAICISFYGGYIKQLNLIYFLTLLSFLPFVFVFLLQLRNKDNGGIISGRDAMKQALKMVLLSTFLLTLFQIVFFEMDFRDYKINHIRAIGPDIIKQEISKGQLKAKVEDIPKILENDIKQVTLFAEITATLFKTIFYGLFSSFISAMILKRKQV